ncbi:MAG: hypothetical protein H7318_04620 [Oligoflexus sp.]|nr:hypothetical protein [Oligoflexus sp.]
MSLINASLPIRGFLRSGSSELGSSLVTVIVAMGLTGLLTVGITQITVMGHKANKSVDFRQKLESIRQIVRNQIDCKKTLGITPITVLPLTCAATTNLTLLRADGQNVGAGDGWILKGNCLSADNELIISASMPGVKDPLTGRDIDSLASNSFGVTVSQDIFGGTSDFCREYYEPPIPWGCSGTYDQFRGNYQGATLCCRVQQTGSTRGTAVATCNANEWILNGTGVCETDAEWWANKAFLHTNNINGATNSWHADCYETLSDPLSPDHPARAEAVCCPSFY